QPLIEYIEKCLEPKTSELTRWTVMLGDRTDSANVVQTADGSLGLFTRAPFPQEQTDGKRSIKRLVSPGEVLLPLEDGSPAWHEALQWAVDRFESGAAKPGTKKPEKPTAAAERHLRS